MQGKPRMRSGGYGMTLPNSTDLLLIAYDEWKRREEHRHIHAETPWVHGWIAGFLSSPDFVKERIKYLHDQEKK
jgi:hypothetical protein